MQTNLQQQLLQHLLARMLSWMLHCPRFLERRKQTFSLAMAKLRASERLVLLVEERLG